MRRTSGRRWATAFLTGNDGMSTIVLIEDDREIGSTLSAVLEGAGYRVVLATNGIDGQRIISAERPDLVITDMMMPRMGGFPVLEFLRTLDSPPKVIMITANEGGRHKAYAEMLGPVDFLSRSRWTSCSMR